MIAANAYVWTPSDHFGMWQLVVAILGFGIAGWQLFRTANATEASSRALGRRLLFNDLLVLLPEIHRLEDDFDYALRAGNRDVSANALLAYSRRVATVVGHLKSDDTLKDEKLVKLLSQAAKAASAAKGDLYSRQSEPVASLVEGARAKMTLASTEIGELTARLQKGNEVVGQ